MSGWLVNLEMRATQKYSWRSQFFNLTFSHTHCSKNKFMPPPTPIRQRQKMHKIHLASKPDQESRSGEMQPIAEKTKCLLISHMIRHLTDPKFLEFLTKYMYPVHILLPNNIYVIIYLNKLKHLVLWVNVLRIASLFTGWVSIITSIHSSILSRRYPSRPWPLHLGNDCWRCHTGRGITDGYIARRIRTSIYATDWTARIREAVCPCEKPNLQQKSLWNQILSHVTINRAVTSNINSK